MNTLFNIFLKNIFEYRFIVDNKKNLNEFRRSKDSFLPEVFKATILTELHFNKYKTWLSEEICHFSNMEQHGHPIEYPCLVTSKIIPDTWDPITSYHGYKHEFQYNII